MTISPDTVEQVRLSNDIVDVVKEYIPSMKRAGRNWKANCPFHHERTPSFMISSEKGIFRCFGCGESGDVFKFVMKMDGLSWPESVKKLAARVGIAVEESKQDIIQKSERQKLFDVLSQTAKFYHRCLKESVLGKKALEYLSSRGVTEETIKRFVIGYAPRNKLITSALKSGLTTNDLCNAGIITKKRTGNGFYEYMSERVVFPIFDVQGRIVAFGGRTLKKDEQPKYLNSPESKVYSKSRNLYGLYQALPNVRKNREITVLEGYMDVVVTHQYGADNTVASLGTALTVEHTALIGRYADKVNLLFDPDSAGNSAACRAIETLADTDFSVKAASLPDGLDPDEYIIKYGREKFYEYINTDSKNAADFLIDYLIKTYGKDTPEKKLKCAREVFSVIEKIKSSILKGEWFKTVSYRLSIDETALKGEWKRYKKGFYKSRKNKLSQKEQGPATDAGIRSVEEEIIQIIAAYPEYAESLREDSLLDSKTAKVFKMLKEKVPVFEIVNRLEESEKEWFTSLIFEEKNYQDSQKIFKDLSFEIQRKQLEHRRKELEKEVVLMLKGEMPSDQHKIELYNNLNRKLKGSVK